MSANEESTQSEGFIHVMQKLSASLEEYPTTFEGFGYRFDESGRLSHIETGESYNFEVKPNDHAYNQERYEHLGELVTEYVYNLLESECGLRRETIPLDVDDDEPHTFIFCSPDAFKKEKLIILIHGSGVVRAGQWSRRLIINCSLNSGTQLPYIKRAIGLGYGVIVLNTNDNKRNVDGIMIKIRGNENPECHANYIWRNVIQDVKAKHIAIIAHSYGGIVTVNMCKTFPESFTKRIFAIAFTDSPHSLVIQGLSEQLIRWFVSVARNWVSSNKPLDAPMPRVTNAEVACVSAGTQRHDETSWMSFPSVFEFIDNQYRQMSAIQDN